MVDLRSAAGMPGRSGMLLVALGALVPHQFEGVASLDQGDALCGEVLELDGFYLGPILLLLQAALRLVGVDCRGVLQALADRVQA